MATEIERKFLLADNGWRAGVTRSEHIAQGYLVGVRALQSGDAHASVRVRRIGDRAWLNIKSATLGIERDEFEYPIPLDDAVHMLARLCDGALEKIRHHVAVDGIWFEVDEFLGDNQGLVVAEVELTRADAAFPRPAWLGREVSALPRYYNVNLIEHPYSGWSDAERQGTD